MEMCRDVCSCYGRAGQIIVIEEVSDTPFVSYVLFLFVVLFRQLDCNHTKVRWVGRVSRVGLQAVRTEFEPAHTEGSASKNE